MYVKEHPKSDYLAFRWVQNNYHCLTVSCLFSGFLVKRETFLSVVKDLFSVIKICVFFFF